jgi:carbon-monoxide dehydrogenase medium subunit
MREGSGHLMNYQTPTSAEDAARLLSQEGAEVLAGGTDLLVKLRAGMASPSVIVDLKSVPKLRGIEHDAKGWRIGAATPCGATHRRRLIPFRR